MHERRRFCFSASLFLDGSDTIKVLEQRHAAQKAAQEGDLGSLRCHRRELCDVLLMFVSRKAEALLPDLKDIAAGERAQVGCLLGHLCELTRIAGEGRSTSQGAGDVIMSSS